MKLLLIDSVLDVCMFMRCRLEFLEVVVVTTVPLINVCSVDTRGDSVFALGSHFVSVTDSEYFPPIPCVARTSLAYRQN